MLKVSPRTIAVVMFFLIIVGLSMVLFDLGNFDLSDRNSILIFGGIFLSALFLLILNFTKPVKTVKHVYSEVKTDVSNEEGLIAASKTEEKTEYFIAEILRELGNKNDIQSYSQKLLSNFASAFHIVQGIFYIKQKDSSQFRSSALYAFYTEKGSVEFEEGDGLNGQTALNKEPELINDLAEGYITAVSGLGSSSPKNLLIIPFVRNNETIALAELAAFEEFPQNMKGIYQGINNVISENISKFL